MGIINITVAGVELKYQRSFSVKIIHRHDHQHHQQQRQPTFTGSRQCTVYVWVFHLFVTQDAAGPEEFHERENEYEARQTILAGKGSRMSE